jgi:NAD(P)-dependent dehydrogenase (short-subunit alcohol dehydrogenase family)
VVFALVLGATRMAPAADVPISGLKLIVVDKTATAGKAKAVFVSKDAAVSKGSGTDPANIAATLDVAYDAVSGAFAMPQGAGWVVNKDTVAKYVNKNAPTDSSVKVSAIKPGNTVKVVTSSLGETPLDISSAPTGNVYVADTIVNGAETTRLCTQFTGCAHKSIAGGMGYKLVCKGNSSGDPDCTAAAPPAPAFDGPDFPPTGGSVSYNFTGDANTASGSDLSFFAFAPTTWTALYWGAWSGSLPQAGLDGSLHALSFAGISGGDTTVTWQGTSPWTDPSDSTVYDVPMRLTITAAITGGASGMGLESARALAVCGAKLELIDLNPEALESAAAGLRQAGAEVAMTLLDVTDPQAVKAAAETIGARNGGAVDILLNSAGIARLHGATDVTDEEWRLVIDVNLTGTFWCCREFGRAMVAAGKGSVINMGSMSGTIVNTPQFASSYMVSKGGVHQLTRALAVEWAKTGVRVNALAPGYISTEMTLEVRRSRPELFARWLEMTPMGRCGTPEEVAAVVVFLASKASTYMTGSILAVDGGYTCL